jgi:hypothetical protein
MTKGAKDRRSLPEELNPVNIAGSIDQQYDEDIAPFPSQATKDERLIRLNSGAHPIHIEAAPEFLCPVRKIQGRATTGQLNNGRFKAQKIEGGSVNSHANRPSESTFG